MRELADVVGLTEGANLSRGLGRAYGDAALSARAGDLVAVTTAANQVIRFDQAAGVLRAESGLSLGDLHDLLWPTGWSCPVLPGTQYVTLGGMVAADVHGKNHHVAGCIGEHVRGLRIRVPGGEILEVDAGTEPELFLATLGGMGLTGHILEVELQLERIATSWIDQETECFRGLDELLDRLQASGRNWPMTVTWADALAGGAQLGRGVLIKGRWAEPEQVDDRTWRRGARITMPVSLPAWAPRRTAVKMLNHAYFHRHRMAAGRALVRPLPFFHPLDAVSQWNRFYGRGGFTQYQCVLPGADAHAAAREVFSCLNRHGAASLLTVIKDFGAAGRGLLSFPMPGITLSLDIPLRLPDTAKAVAALNGLVAEAGGRIYLAKDVLTSSADFRRMEGDRLDRFNAVRDRWDPDRQMRSALSVRLFGDPE